jgi:hypothetical protein
MFEVISDHNGATGARPSCLAKVRMASKSQGVIRDCPVRLRLKYRVHAPE